MRTHKAVHVFEVGGLPQHTYVARHEFDLESRLAMVTDNMCKLAVVSGPTKSGKTVLSRKVLPKEKAVWLDAGGIDNDNQLWTEVVNELEGATSVEETLESRSDTTVTGSVEAEAKVPLLISGTGAVSTERQRSRGTGTRKSRSRSVKAAALAALRESRRPLVIDDFHCLGASDQAAIVRALKPLVFDGQPVVILTIPHRRFDAVKLEREMTGRVEVIEIPPWTPTELNRIPQMGFELLNANVDDSLMRFFAAEALGSPHLMQDFCFRLCLTCGLPETAQENVSLRLSNADTELLLNRIASGANSAVFDRLARAYRQENVSLRLSNADTELLLNRIASGANSAVFDRLARGPRRRSARKQRQLVDGSQDDIYGILLRAIAELGPGVESLAYEEIRDSVREILDYGEPTPRSHEISRVLNHMTEIAIQDGARVPVIEWDAKDHQLHISDPFFAFCLKWGPYAARIAT